MTTKIKYTPMIEQYLKIKEDYADALVFFRLGDFYELFFDDAIIASKILEIALTKRSAGEDIPMCGVPYHSVGPYLEKLINKGFKVAIAEQVTEPGKGLVEREVVKIISPGQVIDDGILNDRKNNYIAALDLAETGYEMSYIDISTGEAYIKRGLTKDELYNEIITLEIKEVILSLEYDKELIDFLESRNIFKTFYSNKNILTNKLVKNLPNDSKKIASYLLNYLNETQKYLSHLMPFEIRQKDELMKIDLEVQKHLEITQSNTQNPKTTLLYWLDETETAMGSRLLKNWLQTPLKQKSQLEKRFDHVEAFMNLKLQHELKEILKYIYDINRIVARISAHSASPKDLDNLKQTLALVPNLKDVLSQFDNKILTNLSENINPHEDIRKLLERSIKENPPLIMRDGGYIKDGYSKELDEYRYIKDHSKTWMANFLEEQKEITGIKNLKIGYNKVFGYYLEVTKGNLDLVKDDFNWERKQTLVNSERFINPELKDHETKILEATDKIINLEEGLFKKVRKEVFKKTHTLQKLAYLISEIDVYMSLAKVAMESNYVRPKINKKRDVKIIEARHPVVEKGVTFVKNDITMKEGEIFLITGPNMSGKSTYMRMFAMIAYMAQVGSFVPAKEATLPLYDAIYTRIGASDDISSGKSTFMVEMVESNEALTNATKDSLILFDEIGRGTATYDGMALAQGMIEYIHEAIGCQTLFSTHYHELTQLEETLSRLTNLHVKAREENNKMVFLYEVEPGKSDRSYGLQVAALANLPKPLLKRSNQILKKLEEKDTQVTMDIFNYEEILDQEEDINILDSNTQQVLDELEYLDLNQMTPFEALMYLKNIQDKLKKKK